MKVQSRCVAAAAATCLFAVAAPARAEEALGLRYVPADGVAEDAAQATEILRRRVKTATVQAEEEPGQAGTLRVEKTATDCVATAELTKPPFEGERSMRAPTCEQALEALGVSLSVLLNAPVEPPASPRARAEEPAHDAVAKPSRREFRVGVGLWLGGDRGYIPQGNLVDTAGEVFVRLAFARGWEADLGYHRQLEEGGFTSPPSRATYADIRGTVSTWAIVARMCRLSSGDDAVLLLRGCARVDAVNQSLRRAQDSAALGYTYSAHVFPAAGLDGGVRLSGPKLPGRPFVEANVAITTAPWRPRWSLDDGSLIYSPSPVQFSAGLGAGLSF